MSTTKRPPLTPSDCAHLGRGLDGLEVLRWESQSREGKRHYTYGTLDAAKDCSCEWRQHHPDTPCKHMLAYVDALAHHLGGQGLLPGQAEVRCPECGYRCELIAQDDGEPGDEWRWTCYACETAWPAGTLPVAPADPGGGPPFRPCWHCPFGPYCAQHGCKYDFASPPGDPGGAVGAPPAPGAARKSLQDHLGVLYGE